jgi:hypothetical protein
MNEIIAVNESDEFSAASIQPRVAGYREATVLPVYYQHPFILRGDPVAYCSACIRRAIIDKDDFEISVCLASNA